MSNKAHGLSAWWGSVLIEKILTPLGLAFFLSGTMLAMVEVFRRYIFGVSFIWQQDFVVMLLLCGVCLFFTVAQWERSHISVTAVAEFISRVDTPRRRRAVQILDAVGDSWTCIFFLLIIIWGLPMVAEYRELGIRLPSQAAPFWPFFLVFMIALFFLVFTYFLHAYQAFRGKVRGGSAAETGK